MIRRKAITTKHEIVKVAADFFLDKGVSNTSPKMVADVLKISTGNITYYFPTKDHLLAVLVEMLCGFQWKMIAREADEGLSSVMAVCLELATMASMCEDNEIAKDFYNASYASDVCLELIQRNDAKRSKQVFGKYCPTWSDEDFAKAEIIVSGIEAVTLRTNEFSPPLETRIASALNAILAVYNVPDEIRKTKVEKVLNSSYRQVSTRIFTEFKEHVAHSTEQAIDAIIEKYKK